MRLILVRHGQTSSNVRLLLDTAAPGADLDDTGRQQALGLVSRLEHEVIDAVYASNLVRTQQTVAPLAEVRALDVQVLPGLREIPAGHAEMGNDASSYVTTMLRWGNGELTARIPGGENALEFMERYDQAIAEIATGGHATALAVSHGAALRVWAAARVPGFLDAIGTAHFANTGWVIAEGSTEDGWELVEAVGFIHYGNDPTQLRIAVDPIN
ncbi:histidine phosphatase family protein [Propionicimonas sp.]|uniref:histidine phosphatase family protein n=1 Tax=Propionicimonas sp. TaxID=1955623 RepID=UPI00183FA79B|nr:histidine phosphatase family protein [Propionicimonas sp.]MBU3977046.1 histidine phosphatase family protein [Actinomycetota bacterium]MBA3020616.1 histidine phosphatase family protein [Propionicimonas sp.]MBU3984986.1 histidine phosphatase family protein [Actinomycetota bacterium]MBU4007057.1 histidine phosphatase family protein [Actinomycetota bacterium]MBU4064810.1 histidine phosphatase family protein [Actinomycetota bacterium]